MGRAVKYLFRLAILAVLGLIAYAYLDDLPPPTRPVEVDLPVPGATEPPPGTAPAEPVEGGAAQQ